MILAYHRINPWYKGRDALTVSPDDFERQMKYLLGGRFEKVYPGEYLSKSSNSRRTYFLTTFDDGYADNLWYGLPVLKNLGIKPVIFLTVNYIGTKEIFKRYKDEERDRFLSWGEVKEMSTDGVEFGSHSLSHPHLTQLDWEGLWAEVSQSKKTIEDRTGKESGIFCYPYGDFDEKVIEAVQKAGYKGAVVTPGVKKNIKSGVYTMPRTGVYGHNSFLTFRIKIWKDYLQTGKHF